LRRSPSGSAKWKGSLPGYRYMLATDPIIAVRLAIPEHVLLALLFPADNRWATLLLRRLLRNRIETAGLTVKSSDSGFQLNRSFYLFTVVERPAGRALAAVQEELAATGLLAWAQIAWRDQDELVWRLSHPKAGIFDRPSQEEFDADIRLASETLERIQKLQQSDGTSGQ